MSINVRECALNSIIRCDKESRYSNLEIDAAIKKYKLSSLDKSFFTALVYGVIERKITLDYVIKQNSNIEIDKLDLFVLNILRLGAYQILFLDRTPNSAAVNESVEIAKRRCKLSSANFVNAVLRSITRKGIVYPSETTVEYYSIKYSLPCWMIEMWTEQYGKEKTIQILEEVNKNPNITLRVNTLKISVEELVKKLQNDGINSYCDKDITTGVIINQKVSVDRLYVDEGLCYIQDLSSQKSISKLGVKPGETVIDCCSCPGGKSFYCGIEMQNQGNLYSFDLHKNKLSLVEKTGSMLGISIINTAEVNGCNPREELFECADRVICDVPCSGLGVISKKPDIRYKNQEDFNKLPNVQYNILNNSCRYVKHGGYILYSTCTINKNENEEVVKRFLDNNEEYSLIESETIFPSQNYDGFFYALILRK